MDGHGSSDRVVVTGATGALGEAVCRRLASEGHEVVALDVRRPVVAVPGVRYVEADLTNPSSFGGELRAGAAAVIHTAALHGYHMLHLKVDPSVVFTNNVLSTFHVAAACARYGIRKLVITSSASIYDVSDAGHQHRALWLEETARLGPRDRYDETKVMAEQIGEYWADRGVGVTCLRTTRFFYDDDVSYNLRKLWRGADVRDVALAHLLAARHPATGYTVYNVAAKSPFAHDDCPRLWSQPTAVLERYYPGIAQTFARNGWALPQAIDRVIDISRAEHELGFRPQHNFDSFWGQITRAARRGAGSDAAASEAVVH